MACTSSSCLITCRTDSAQLSGRSFTALIPGWQSLGRALVCLIITLSGHAFAQADAPALAARVQYGIASWYGVPFHGRKTSNGERYDMFQLSAAHKEAPLGIHAIVTHMRNGRSVRVRINDRGPFVKNRLIDLSYGAAQQLGFAERGLALVKVEFLPDTIPEQRFIVQAGAFSSPQNATLAQRTLQIHYPAIRVIKQGLGAALMYRVHLGPFTERQAAEQAMHRIKALGYQALVLPQS